LTESSTLRPLPDYPYSAHKAECEELVEDFRREHPDTVVTVFRPAMVCGPHVDGPIGRMLEAPVLLSVTGYEPPLQAVHERDAAAALVYALDHDLDGAYNLCAADWIPQGDLGRLSGKRTVSMGAEDAKRRLELLWQMGVSALPSGFVAFLMHPTVMSNDKLVKAGFEFRYGTREALRDALEARRGWVSVGGMRFRPRMVAVGLAGGAVLAGSVLRGIVRAARRA
jgi:nucleoside-diphosphate-sugar epimerase